MNDGEIKSNCNAEQEVYDAFKERLEIGRFVDKLGDALDELLDDYVDEGTEKGQKPL